MTATEGAIRTWIAGYKRDFNGLCQAFVWQLINKFGSAPVAYASAKAAYKASKIESTDPTKAPGGAVHYWSNPATYYHVAYGLGGERVIMGSSRSGEKVGINVIITTVTAYGKSSYLGWSYANGQNKADFAAPATPASSQPGKKDWYTSTEVDGDPGSVYWQMLDMYRAQFLGNVSRDQAIRTMVGREVNRMKHSTYTDAAEGKARGKYYWMAVQKQGNLYEQDVLKHLNISKLKVDGIPGTGSQAVEYAVSAWVMNQAL